MRPEPRAFGSAARPLLGFLHRPAGGLPVRESGLVICKPFGYEATCAHHSLRHFAEAATAIGMPALRFDYDGTGDSAGDDRDPGRVPAWVDSVKQAVDELRRATGVRRVYLLGVRLGATLAALAAAERDDVAGLVAIVPVVAGRAWLREMNALEIAMGFAGPPPEMPVRTGERDAAGYVITDETKDALSATDLAAMTRAPGREVLILDRDDLPLNRKWADRLASLGVALDHQQAPGYPTMMLDPHDAVPPARMIEITQAWLTARRGEPLAGAAAAAPPAREVGPLQMAPGVEETFGYLDPSDTLFGVVSAPAGTARPSRAIVLLNAGSNPHTGPSRFYVQLARRWASRGYLVLRFDQAGIGDSPPFPGDRENVVYSRSALRGIELAFQHLAERWQASQFQAVGLCSGAYHAFKAAVAGLPLRGVGIVNPLAFFWKPGMSLAYPPYQVLGAAARYKRSILSVEKWQKFFAGKVDVKAFVYVVFRRLADRAETLVRNVARSLGRPLHDDLGAELEAVAARGVALRFVFATGDSGDALLSTQAGSSLPRLLRDGRLRVTRIAGPNHAFTPTWTRDALTTVLEAELDVR